MNILLPLFVISLTFNLTLFLVAYYFRTDKLTDISYALTFITISLIGVAQTQYTFSTVLLTFMICMWAARLGIYLLQRIRKIGRDKRFDGRRENFLAFAGFWILQGITVWVVLLPSMLLYSTNLNTFTILSVLGVIIWVLGLIIETVADYQKYTFINDSKNKGKWVTLGLWSYSRHPNYFGEILVWVGIFIFTLPHLTLVQALLGSISPLYIATLLIFVSGIPLLEKSADTKWGANPEYQAYKKKTSILLLLPHKK